MLKLLGIIVLCSVVFTVAKTTSTGSKTKTTPSDKKKGVFFGLPAQIHENNIMPFQKFLRESVLARDLKVDERKDSNAFDFDIPIPGASKEDISITKKYQKLTIEVETLLPVKEANKGKNLSTRSIRPKIIHLPDNADAGNTKAEYTNGVLHLKIKRLAEETPNKIHIR